MYRQITVDEHKRYLGLPKDYSVSGFLCHGTWKRDEEIANLKQALTELDLNFKINAFPDSSFLRRMVEIKIGDKKIWFDIPYGGAMLSEFLHLACLLGSKKNIVIGSCGGLSTNLNVCDVILPSWSYGDESSTRMYEPKNKNNRHCPDKKLVNNLKTRLETKYKIFEGPTTTCEAMLAESEEDVKTWSKEGYLGVEMEAATVFAVSNHFKVPSAAILLVGDNLIKKESVLQKNYLKMAGKRKEIRQEFLKTAIKEILD
ncbi:MAG: Uridine phosphorylase (Udp) [Microgenomates bacterium 39_6]|nr:MAG: Uridine phosphorylase (Udp) [Microgenomates bacterium 39_6]